MPLYLWRRKDDRSGNWYIRGTVTVWRNGAMRSVGFKPKSTRTPRRAEAEAILTHIAARYQRSNIENREAPALFSDLINAYLDAGKSPRYLDPINDALGDLEIHELTQQVIDAAGRRAYPNVAPPTLRRQWHGIILAVCRHSGHRLELSLPAKSRSTTRFCTPAQAEALIAACRSGRYANPWLVAMAEIMFGTGCRADEVMSLDASRDVDLHYGTLTFRDTKNGTERTNELCDRTLRAIRVLPNVGEPGPLMRKLGGKLFAERQQIGGHQMRGIRAAAKRAGIIDFNPHMTRHSFATWFYAQTKDTMRLRRVAGWKKAEMIDRYVHIAPARIGDDAAALGWEWREGVTKSVERPISETRSA